MRASRVSVLARFGAAAAVAAIALVSATAASAAPAHHARKAPTSLAVHSHFVRGTHHKSDVINGLLRSRRHALAGETVALESRSGHHTKFTMVASATSNSSGKVSFTVTPIKRTAYKLVFAGDATHRRCRSAVVVLRAPRHRNH